MAESHILQNAQGFVMNHPQLMNNPQITHVHEAEKQGLKILLGASIPAAAYDSSEHPRHCHPGTRCQYIDQIVKWGLNDADRGHRIFWLKGPAGVGKSAIAQSCAEEFATQRKLAAAFFFSRPNERDDPQRLFTSISYQWASRCKPYGEILKSTIHDDPTIVDKELSHQFLHLFVSPLQELSAKGERITEQVIIVDGLDECAGETAQQEIVKTIAASIRGGTTPFIWVFCSRLEPHLIATFNSRVVSAVTRQEELMVSRDIDNEIARYLTDELAGIAEEHGLSLPWPRERDIGTLINLSSGLFIYASTVVRFIGDRNSLGPEDQLQAILALVADVVGELPEHPLSELDLFYLLILQRIPSKILPTVQQILLAATIAYTGRAVEDIRQFLGLSTSQFHAACRALHSVLKVKDAKIIFYHASFMDFMQSPRRSRQFSIWSDCGLALRGELMRRLRAVCDNPDIKRNSGPFCTLLRINRSDQHTYEQTVRGLIFLCSILPLDTATLTALTIFNFKKMADLWASRLWSPLRIDALFRHIPEDHRNKIIRSCKDRDKHVHAWEVTQMPSGSNWDGSYILGHGQRKCFCWCSSTRGTFCLRPYPKRPAAERSSPENLTAEYPSTGRPATGRPVAEHTTAECPTAEHTTTKKTHRTLMQRIKFWKTRTFRSLIR